MMAGNRLNDELRPLGPDDLWVMDAACSTEALPDLDLDAAGSYLGPHRQALLEACAGCPVIEQCEQAAIEEDIRHGVRAGRSWSKDGRKA